MLTMELRLEQTVRQRKPQAGRYGMKYRTIRYFQDQAKSLQRYYGWPSCGAFELRRRYLDTFEQRDVRTLAHELIQLAIVSSPETLKYVLGGK